MGYLVEWRVSKIFSCMIYMLQCNAFHSPGASSMLGLMLENGPLHVAADGSIIGNNFSWDKVVDYIWVDQPV